MRRVLHKRGIFFENELLSSHSEPQTPLSSKEVLGHEVDEKDAKERKQAARQD